MSSITYTGNEKHDNSSNGGALKGGSVATVRGCGTVALGMPPDSHGEDWRAVVRRTSGGDIVGS